MKEKIKKVGIKFKKHLEKISKNYRWEVRYNNLMKKYDKDIEYYENEIKKYKKLLNKDELVLEVEGLKRSLRHRTMQRDLLRKDNKELMRKLESANGNKNNKRLSDENESDK